MEPAATNVAQDEVGTRGTEPTNGEAHQEELRAEPRASSSRTGGALTRGEQRPPAETRVRWPIRPTSVGGDVTPKETFLEVMEIPRAPKEVVPPQCVRVFRKRGD